MNSAFEFIKSLSLTKFIMTIGFLFIFMIFLFTSENGKIIINALVNPEPQTDSKKIVITGNNNNIYLPLTTRNERKYEEILSKVDNFYTKTLPDAYNREIKEDKERKIFMDKNHDLIMLTKQSNNIIRQLKLLNQMKNNSQKIIKAGVDTLPDDIKYKKEFIAADLDFIKDHLTEMKLDIIESTDNKKKFAQQAMLKSMSNYIDFEPDLAIDTYNKAKGAYPQLDLISKLSKEYSILKKNKNTLSYAYILIASVVKNEKNLNTTADVIIGLGNANKLRQLGYSLYLNVNSNEIRVYTIVEHYSKIELTNKINMIDKYVVSPLPYRIDANLPKEYFLIEKRKNIYVWDSSSRNNDVSFSKRLINLNYRNVEAKGKWNKEFGIYALYYDGNAYDKNDLEKILKETRDIVGSYVVYSYAYQQSKSNLIRKLFQKNLDLKYLIILEKNSLINSVSKKIMIDKLRVSSGY